MFAVVAPLLCLTGQALAQDAGPWGEEGARGVAHTTEEDVASRTSERWAVIIGADRYEDENIVSLRFSDDDARALAGALVESGSFRSDHVTLMTSDAPDPALRPTRNNILGQLSRLREHAGADLILVYYSGHGIGDGEGAQRENLLVPMDARLDTALDTALPVDRVLDALAEVQAARRVVIFDACRNKIRQGVRGDVSMPWDSPRYADAEGLQVLYCTRYGEVSFEDDKLGHGACTYELLQGLAGGADGIDGQPPDSVISMAELRIWLEKHLPEREFAGLHQTPYVAGEWSGDFALAQVMPLAGSDLPAPGAKVTDADLASAAQIALKAHQTGDARAFFPLARALPGAVTGLDERISTDTARALHQVDFLDASERQDHEVAVADLRAVVATAPGRPPLPGLEPYPPGYDALSAAELETTLRATERPPPGVTLWVDGRRERSLPANRPAVVQALNCDGSVQKSLLLWPGDPAPPLLSGVLRECRLKLRVGLGLGTGVSWVAAGGLLAGGLIEKARFEATIGGRSAPLGDAVDEAAHRHEDWANGLGYAAQASAVLGVGLGVGWLTVTL